ncbi:MAG: methyltransferase domain-containing protein [Planctomycetes bacterium]|nr:methyltransferase domain-containing protein [Planctomycetota bacterium]
MELTHSLKFLKQYVCDPNVVGAVAPSSRALAEALCEPLRAHAGPACILEVGAGTGAITRYIGTVLQDEHELDVCEIQPDFADILERDVLSMPVFDRHMRAGRVRLFRCPIQELTEQDRYDFIISGLPLTVFELEDVQAVFAVIRRCLRPGGVFSYFEYIGLRRTSRVLALGKRRRRIRSVSAYLSDHIRAHQFRSTTVLRNFLPAHARHLRFDG